VKVRRAVKTSQSRVGVAGESEADGKRNHLLIAESGSITQWCFFHQSLLK
jgi:hypothetical protein